MSQERIIFWILLPLILIAGFLFINQQPTGSTILFVGGLLIALLFINSLHLRVRNFSKSHLNSTVYSFSALLSEVEARLFRSESEIKQIIAAIDKVGTADQLTDENLEGEVGQAIIALQQKLLTVKEVENQRVWAAQGIAAISEIRKDNAELADYSFHVISSLVKFVKANQGAFYSLTDEADPVLELLSTYAYGKRKFSGEKVSVAPGTGLVGQCVLEREMILLTDVPKDYIKITSGLGAALPRCIVILPLMFRDHVYGVIEIASFEKLQPFQLEFLSKACETIALELSGIRAQERTRKLLEQSREEELRQNLEEMKVTQQKMLMKEEELSRQLLTTKRAMAMAESEQKKNEAILEGCMDAVISFNQQGQVEYFNKAAEEVFGVTRQQVIGQPVENIFKIQIEAQDDDFKIISSTGNEVSLRTEINAVDSNGEIISLLLTATKVKIDSKYLFTLFAQKVSVDLF